MWARAVNGRASSRCSATRGRPATSRARLFPGNASPALLLWNFCRLDHPRPALRLADEELAQVLRRARARLDAELGKAFLHIGRGERLLELGVHAPHDRR